MKANDIPIKKHFDLEEYLPKYSDVLCDRNNLLVYK